jgi:transcriptional regulator with XRE-family HTH domain
MSRKGLSWARLSERLGFNPGHLRRVQGGLVPDNRTLQDMARALGVPLDAIDPRVEPSWRAATYASPETIALLDDEMAHAQTILTVHRLVEFYALPEAFQPALQGRLQQGRYAHHWKQDQWAAYGRGNFLAKGRAIRETCRFRHRILAPEAFFSRVFEPEWIEQTEHRVRAIGEETALGLLGAAEFAAADRAISGLLASHGIPEWEKFYVINDYLVAVRLPTFMYLFCYHRPTARAVLAKLEALTRYDPYMPGGDRLTPTAFSTCARKTRERLQKLRLGLEAMKPTSPA